MAEHNCSMAIWLGKQYLGQKDQQEISLADGTDESICQMNDYFSKRKQEEQESNGGI